MNGIVSSDIPHTCRRIKITDLNPHLMCVLCGGYYIDATTIIECLHSFCKTCIVRYLDTSKFCPICDVQVHKTKPLLNIRSDQTLQDIVYKLVPGLFQSEMKRRRDFYASHPQEDKNCNPRSNEERGEVESDFPRNFFKPDEFISIALEYSESGGISNSPDRNEHNEKSQVYNEDFKCLQNVCRRYLRCPVFSTVAHIKKLIRAKYSLSTDHRIDILFSQDNLNDDYMLMDIAYMYAWKRKGPLKLFFRIFERPGKRLKTFHRRTSLFGPDRVRNTPSHTTTNAKKESSPAPDANVTEPNTTNHKESEAEPQAKTENMEKRAAEKSKETNCEGKVPTIPADDRRTTPAPETEKTTNKITKNGICKNNNSATENDKNKSSNNNNNEEEKTDENLKPKEKSETTQNPTNGTVGPKAEAPLLEKVNGLLPAANGKDSAVKLLQVEAKQL